jgi:hypothetical protein
MANLTLQVSPRYVSVAQTVDNWVLSTPKQLPGFGSLRSQYGPEASVESTRTSGLIVGLPINLAFRLIHGNCENEP